MESPERRRRSRGQFSIKTPERLMARLRDANALMAKPHWRVADFPKYSAQWNACARRYWYEKARDMPVHLRARHHYINLLKGQAEFYEFQQAQTRLVASGAAEHAEKVAAAERAKVEAEAKAKAEAEKLRAHRLATLAATEKKKRENNDHFRKLLGGGARSAGAGIIFSIFDFV